MGCDIIQFKLQNKPRTQNSKKEHPTPFKIRVKKDTKTSWNMMGKRLFLLVKHQRVTITKMKSTVQAKWSSSSEDESNMGLLATFIAYHQKNKH